MEFRVGTPADEWLTGATNGPSNALCRKAGFEQLESLDVEYAGRPLHINHWVWRAP